MKFLENWSKWEPIPEETKKWEEYLENNWGDKIYQTKFGKMIQIDDKSYHLNNKGDIKERLYWTIVNSGFLNISPPSLRRAIKNFIDNNN
jgi:hypothetical protein